MPQYTGRVSLRNKQSNVINPATEEVVGLTNGILTFADFLLRVTVGVVEGAVVNGFFGKNPQVKANGTRQLLSDVHFGHPNAGIEYVHLTAQKILQGNSDNAADIGFIVVVIGYDDNYQTVVSVFVTNGKTKVNLSAELRFIETTVNVSPDAPAGNIYVTEDATIGEDGVPVEVALIKSRFGFKRFGFNPIIAIPEGKQIIFSGPEGAADSTKDVEIGIEVLQSGQNYFGQTNEFNSYQNTFSFGKGLMSVFAPGQVYQLIAKTKTENANIVAIIQGVEVPSPFNL